MKKKTMIIIGGIVAIVAIITIIAVVFSTKNNGNSIKLETTKDIENMLKTIYSKNVGTLPMLETGEIDVSNSELVTSYTGIQSTSSVESLIVLEPPISSQAYSTIAIKLKENTNVESIKEEILNNINMDKWICVSAEKLYITNYDNVIFAVMADEDWAEATYKSFKEYVNNNIGKELEKTGEEDIQLPPEVFAE